MTPEEALALLEADFEAGARWVVPDTAEFSEDLEFAVIETGDAPLVENTSAAGPSTEATASADMVVTRWPVEWVDTQADPQMAIAQACDLIKEIRVGNSTALIGVALGPPAADMKQLEYREFMRKMQAVMTEAADREGLSSRMNFRESRRPVQFAQQPFDQSMFTFRGFRDKQVAIYTGVQKGHGVAYWFVGPRKVYSEFKLTVGRAELGPGT